METIYADRLFLLNFIIDYLLLLVSARLCALPLRRIRFAAGAALGGVYAVLTVLPELAFLSGGVMKLVSAAAMVLLAFGGEKKLLRPALTFLVISAAFGGAVWAASMLGGGMRPGGIVVPVSMRVLALSFALCYAAVSIAFRRIGRRTQRCLHEVEITAFGKHTRLRALHDSGNELFDPITGCTVMIAERAAVSALLPAIPPGSDPVEAVETLNALPGCAGRFRLIPYSAVGVETALLPAFRPDRLVVDGREEKNVLAALAPNRLCTDGEFAAIL